MLRGVVERLADIYAGPAVVICPMWCGSGLSIKLVEATRTARRWWLRRLPPKVWKMVPAKRFWWPVPADFVDLVAGLLHDREHRQQLENNAAQYTPGKFMSKYGANSANF